MPGKAQFGLPSYIPLLWNDFDLAQLNNNCYNYACDIRDGSYAQPGQGGGKPFRWHECNELIRALEADGLIFIGRDRGQSCPANSHLIALVLKSARGPNDRSDFHFYRRDGDGGWSHKDGKGLVTREDESGRTISDPETCDRGEYTEFCGYLCVDKSRVRIGSRQ